MLVMMDWFKGLAWLVLVGSPVLWVPASADDSACPADRSYGEPSDNRLTLRSGDGVRRFHFEQTYAVLEKAAKLTLWFPPVGSRNADELYQWGIKVQDPFTRESGSGTYKAGFEAFSKGKHGALGCYRLPNIPGGGFGEPEEVGELKVEKFASDRGFFSTVFGSEPERTLKARFRSPSYELKGNPPDTVSSGGREARIETTRILEIKDHALGSGNHCRSDADMKPLNKGHAVHHPGQQWLRFSGAGDQCTANFVIRNLSDGPGLYVGSTSFGEVDFYIIDALSGDQVKGQKRVVKKEDFPGEDKLSLEKARGLGRLQTRFNVEKIIRHPELDPVIVDD